MCLIKILLLALAVLFSPDLGAEGLEEFRTEVQRAAAQEPHVNNPGRPIAERVVQRAIQRRLEGRNRQFLRSALTTRERTIGACNVSPSGGDNTANVSQVFAELLSDGLGIATTSDRPLTETLPLTLRDHPDQVLLATLNRDAGNIVDVLRTASRIGKNLAGRGMRGLDRANYNLSMRTQNYTNGIAGLRREFMNSHNYLFVTKSKLADRQDQLQRRLTEKKVLQNSINEGALNRAAMDRAERRIQVLDDEIEALEASVSEYQQIVDTVWTLFFDGLTPVMARTLRNRGGVYRRLLQDYQAFQNRHPELVRYQNALKELDPISRRAEEARGSAANSLMGEIHNIVLARRALEIAGRPNSRYRILVLQDSDGEVFSTVPVEVENPEDVPGPFVTLTASPEDTPTGTRPEGFRDLDRILQRSLDLEGRQIRRLVPFLRCSNIPEIDPGDVPKGAEAAARGDNALRGFDTVLNNAIYLQGYREP